MPTIVIHIKNKDFYKPTDLVYIGRPSKWGNPFSHKTNTLANTIVSTRDMAIRAYELYLSNGDGKHLLKDLHELKDKVLVCYCKPQACHGDILAELANKL